MKLLSILFPPRFHKVECFESACVAAVKHDPFFLPADESCVLWRAYDVRKTGIEKMKDTNAETR